MALVGHPPALNGFGALVAQNRGMDAKVFATAADAMRWLDDLPGETSRHPAETLTQRN
jgi:hypothetical protein